MQQRHKNLDVSGRICITPNNKVFLGGHHHQAAAALACLIRVRKKTKTPKLFDHSSFTLRMYQIPFKTGTFDHKFLRICIHGCLWHTINLSFSYEGALAIIKFLINLFPYVNQAGQGCCCLIMMTSQKNFIIGCYANLT